MEIANLLSWYQHHQRPLPFRISPTPYGIWISEVMLQQTQMETVLRYYDSFLKKFPDVKTLAHAPLDAVLTEIQGLGYYRRFRLLHQGANHILKYHQGVFPKTYEAVMAIPGIGRYTAGAIMAIAFNQPYPATDGNVIRVLSRYFGIKDDMRMPKSFKKIDALHAQLVQQTDPRTYVQAVMELGALVCRPLQPQCEICPLQHGCVAFQKNQTNIIPLIGKKPPKKNREWQTLVIQKGHKILLKKNTDNLLKDLYLLPQWESKLEAVELWLQKQAFSPITLVPIKTFKHVFTHQTWWMEGYHLKIKQGNDLTGLWVDINALHTVAIPEAHQKILREVFPQFQKAKLYNK